MNIPVGYYFNRMPNPYTGAAGDATFPKVVAIATYSFRFGGTMSHIPVPVHDGGNGSADPDRQK
jgi:hypothetical protein